MNEETSNPNIEWKKSGIGTNEKLSLKINTKEAALYDAKKKNNLRQKVPVTPADLPNGIRKIRKKINQSLLDDEEEDENEVSIVSSGMALDQANSLLNALNDDEKMILKQQETLQNIKMQQTAGKMEAVATASRFAQQQGLKGLNKAAINRTMQDAGLVTGEAALKKTIEKNVAKDLKLKGSQLPEAKFIQFLRGLKNIQAIGGVHAVEGMRIDEVVQAGDQNAAKILLEKTGRIETKKKKQPKKAAAGKQKAPAQKNKVLFQKKKIRDQLWREAPRS